MIDANNIQPRRCNMLIWMLIRVEEEVSAKTAASRQMRALEDKIQDLEDDLKTNIEAKNKVEKQKRDLSEVIHYFDQTIIRYMGYY